MSLAKEGDTVKVNYTGKFEDGSVFDSSEGREPLQFTLGSGQVIPGFEEAIIGMGIGDKKTANIPVDKAYGPVRPEMIIEVGMDQFPDDLNPEVGQQLQLTQQDGSIIVVTIAEKTDDKVKLDANHPLAGKPLVFDVELIEIV